jgi:hypothetical protein
LRNEKRTIYKKSYWDRNNRISYNILIVWLDELLDLPHIFFGALASPINYFESIFESILISLRALAVIFWTHSILQRLKVFEGILPVCSFCKKIRSENRWIPIEHYISEHSEADFSHSMCPECRKANYGDIIE